MRGRIKLAGVVVAALVVVLIAVPFAADVVVKQMLEQRGFSWKSVKRDGLSWRFRDLRHAVVQAGAARLKVSVRPELKLQNATVDMRQLLSTPWDVDQAPPKWLYIAADPLSLNWGEAEIGSGIRGRLSSGRAVASGPTLKVTGGVGARLQLRAQGDISVGPMKFDGNIEIKNTQPLTLQVTADKVVFAGPRIGPEPIVMTDVRGEFGGSVEDLAGAFSVADVGGELRLRCGATDAAPCKLNVTVPPAPAGQVIGQLRSLSKTLARADLSGKIGGEATLDLRTNELALALQFDRLKAKRTRIRPARLNGDEFVHYVTTSAGRRIEWRLSDDADEWTALDDVAPVMAQAIMAAHDPKFAAGTGVDSERMTAAVIAMYGDAEPGFGGRTLTQALVDRLRRKGAAASLARQVVTGVQALELKRTLGSDRVMELLLNVFEWGPDVHGIMRAAEYYFEKGPADLEAHEAAFLALLVSDPHTLHEEWFESKQPDRRAIKRVLETMLKQEWIDEDDFEEAHLTPFDWEQ